MTHDEAPIGEKPAPPKYVYMKYVEKVPWQTGDYKRRLFESLKRNGVTTSMHRLSVPVLHAFINFVFRKISVDDE